MTPLAWLRCSSCVSHLVGRCGVATGGEPGGGGDELRELQGWRPGALAALERFGAPRRGPHRAPTRKSGHWGHDPAQPSQLLSASEV